VPLKGEAQLDLQSLHRVREGLVARLTALISQVRELLLERGIAMPQGRRKLQQRLPEILADETAGLSPRMRHLVADLQAEWRALDLHIAELVAYARQDEACRRLIEMPGIGATIATALVAAVGRGRAFEAGRGMAVWLGLVPRQCSTARD
jgi:transposase